MRKSEHVGYAILCCLYICIRDVVSPAAKGGDPEFSDIVFFSADYLSLGSKKIYLGWCGGFTFEQFYLFKMAAIDVKKLRKRLSYDGLDYIKGKHSVNMSCNV